MWVLLKKEPADLPTLIFPTWDSGGWKTLATRCVIKATMLYNEAGCSLMFAIIPIRSNDSIKNWKKEKRKEKRTQLDLACPRNELRPLFLSQLDLACPRNELRPLFLSLPSRVKLNVVVPFCLPPRFHRLTLLWHGGTHGDEAQLLEARYARMRSLLISPIALIPAKLAGDLQENNADATQIPFSDRLNRRSVGASPRSG